MPTPLPISDFDQTPLLESLIQSLSPEEQEFIATYRLYAPGAENRLPAGLAAKAIAFYLNWKANMYLNYDAKLPINA